MCATWGGLNVSSVLGGFLQGTPANESIDPVRNLSWIGWSSRFRLLQWETLLITQVITVNVFCVLFLPNQWEVRMQSWDRKNGLIHSEIALASSPLGILWIRKKVLPKTLLFSPMDEALSSPYQFYACHSTSVWVETTSPPLPRLLSLFSWNRDLRGHELFILIPKSSYLVIMWILAVYN